MPVYSALFIIFMLASIGLPGLSGFIGEFLVALATWQYNKWLALITFSVVIFAAWYMMWMFQRVIFGRQPRRHAGPGRHRTDSRRSCAELDAATAAGTDHGHGDAAAGLGRLARATTRMSDDAHPDANHLQELLTLVPLAALTIFFGVYPKPIFDIVGPTFERISAAVPELGGTGTDPLDAEWSELSGSAQPRSVIAGLEPLAAPADRVRAGDGAPAWRCLFPAAQPLTPS